MRQPATYAKKYSNALLKKIGVNKPKSFSGKFGSTSKYGGAKVVRRGKNRSR